MADPSTTYLTLGALGISYDPGACEVLLTAAAPFYYPSHFLYFTKHLQIWHLYGAVAFFANKLLASKAQLWEQLTFCFRYILAKPGLLAMMLELSLFAFPHDLSRALCSPMILARSGGDAQV